MWCRPDYNAASGAQASSNSDVARADAASPQTGVVSKTVPSLGTMTHQKRFVPPAALLPLIQLTNLAFLPTAIYVLGNWAGAVPELLVLSACMNNLRRDFTELSHQRERK